MATKKYQNLLYKELSYQIQGAAIEVRKNFGSGLKETIYQNAFAEELRTRDIKFDKEKSIQIFSPKTGKLIGSYRPDFIVENKILIELKAVEKIPKMFLDQIFSYLRNSKYELGYFINFTSPKLYIKRVIFTNDRKPFLRNTLSDTNIKRTVTKISCLLVFLLVSFSVLPAAAQAATFGFSTLGDAAIGQFFEVSVFLNSDYERINAVQGSVIFPDNVLYLKEIHDGNSIVNLWVERPRLSGPGKIFFSGIIPGGYMGVKGPLFSFIVKGNTEAKSLISLQDEKAFLNDGLGTAAKTKISNLSFTISEGLQTDNLVSPEDTVSPEPFSLFIDSDPSLFQGQWFLVFVTQDKGSGIGRYEVKEGSNPFIVAQSPYLLKYQSLDRNITVKAVDSAGNTRIASLSASHPRPWYKEDIIWIIIILVIIFLVIKKNLWKIKHTK